MRIAIILYFSVTFLAHGQNRIKGKPFDTDTIGVKQTELTEIVLTGNLKPSSRRDSPVPIELYQPKFFKTKPTASLFDAISAINGIRPQINCSVCNAGDIHINGQEGANTMILIDGMPIISGLGSVYGLMGIPMSLVKSIEVIKGPASTLFGSEAIGGVININTVDPKFKNGLSLEAFRTNWDELNIDLGVPYHNPTLGAGILGVNYFNNNSPIDNNLDGFTDIVLQNRISVFNKISKGRLSIAGRFFYEDRWGGQTGYNSTIHRLQEEVYGEQITTKRVELFGNLTLNDQNNLQFSINRHYQDAAYGTTSYIGDQRIAFLQYVQHSNLGDKNQLTSGLSYRYTYYDDNTPATANVDLQHLPGIFTQIDSQITEKQRLLVGARLDYNTNHGLIFSPRISYKLQNTAQSETLRISLGNGYRVVNIFTEDHAALSGSRTVVVDSHIRPEQSWNTALNYSKTITSLNTSLVNIELALFYSHFSNKIIPDYDQNPLEINYANLEGYAESYGFSINLNAVYQNGIRWNLGGTFLDQLIHENETLFRPVFSERYNLTYQLTVPIRRYQTELSFSGNMIGPMRLPLLSDKDPRPAYSKLLALGNLQLEKKLTNQYRIRIGLRNVFNALPPDNSISRAFDPFDKEVTFDVSGNALSTPNNPDALVFDPSYSYASFQERNAFIGLSINF